MTNDEAERLARDVMAHIDGISFNEDITALCNYILSGDMKRENAEWSAWLIEARDAQNNLTAVYWVPTGATTDAWQAVHFVRQEDAEKVIRSLPNTRHANNWVAVSHGFDTRPR